MTADFKATDRLVDVAMIDLQLRLGEFYNRELTFMRPPTTTPTTTAAPVLARRPDDGADQRPRHQHLANVAIGGTNASKRTHTITLAPKFEYKVGSWTSRASRAIPAPSTTTRRWTGLRAQRDGEQPRPATGWRPGPTSPRTSGRSSRLSGNDWFNLANFTNPRTDQRGPLRQHRDLQRRAERPLGAPVPPGSDGVQVRRQVGRGGSQQRQRDLVLHVAIHRPRRKHLQRLQRHHGRADITTAGSWAAYPERTTSSPPAPPTS
jgi:hypothetical protein